MTQLEQNSIGLARWDRDRLAKITNAWPEAERPTARFPFWALAAAQSFAFLPPFDPSDPRNSQGTEVVELARIRWAAGTAATSIDLCAAFLGIRYNGRSLSDKAAALIHFIPSEHKGDHKAKAEARCSQHTAVALRWKDQVWADADYQVVRGARHPFTHSALARDVRVMMGDPAAPREYFDDRSSNEIVDISTKVADTHLAAFFDGLEAGVI